MNKVSLKNINDFFALGFGSGLLNPAPGTWGTLAGLPLVLIISYLPIWLQLILILSGFFIGVKVCETTANRMAIKDPSAIVWDEIIGISITLFLVPLNYQLWILGFILFRFFDILKPWPISFFDTKFKGGLGIMLDDVVAGLFAWGILQIVIWQFY